jgi:hypothetical protein
MARQPGWPSMARNAGLCEMSSTPKRPRDFSQAAKLVIDIANSGWFCAARWPDLNGTTRPHLLLVFPRPARGELVSEI